MVDIQSDTNLNSINAYFTLSFPAQGSNTQEILAMNRMTRVWHYIVM